MRACNCLNVVIETEDNDFQKVTSEVLGLTKEELEDQFFKQDIQQVGKLININKSHSGLIQTRNVGSWVVHYCINCGVHSHAVHREKGASCVLVNSELLSKDAIEKIRSSTNFSKLYKIVVNIEEKIDDDATVNSYLPNEVENAIKGFKQIASEVLKNEAYAVEDRIKQYTDEQYRLLNELRERAFREQQALTKIIINNTVDPTSKQPTSTNVSMSNPPGVPSRLNEPLAAGSVNTPSNTPKSNQLRHTPKRQKSCPSQTNAADIEGVFEFDSIDDMHANDVSETEDSDTEEIKDDSDVKPMRGEKINSGNGIAKSLPMTIPTFLSQARNRAFEDVDDVAPVEANLDIAASIKALAKSVHGDTVFGDLPKPRYTYI